MTEATKEILSRQHVNHLSEYKLADAIESAERERCAKIAECHAYNGGDYKEETQDIAAEIRKDRGSDPPQAEIKSPVLVIEIANPSPECLERWRGMADERLSHRIEYRPDGVRGNQPL